MSDGELDFENGPLSSRSEPIEGRLAEISRLQDGWWDGYGKAIQPRAVEAVRKWFGGDFKPVPYVYPMECGGVVCEWNPGLSIAFGAEDIYFHHTLGAGPDDFVEVVSTWEDPMPAIESAKAALTPEVA